MVKKSSLVMVYISSKDNFPFELCFAKIRKAFLFLNIWLLQKKRLKVLSVAYFFKLDNSNATPPSKKRGVIVLALGRLVEVLCSAADVAVVASSCGIGCVVNKVF